VTFHARRTELSTILPFRRLYLQEMNVQIRYDACHARGWTDSYALTIDGQQAGYGAIKGQEIADRDTIFEFYVIPPFRRHACDLFGALLAASSATYIECQSNDAHLSPMLGRFARDVRNTCVLFLDDAITAHTIEGATVRRRREGDRIFRHHAEPEGDFVVDLRGDIVATGGFLLHYNMPFADLYMEVHEAWRRKGIGAFLVQEVKKQCYLAGRAPAARCGVENDASKATLLKAGFRAAGFMQLGRVNRP
jgi:GNAT superfamily N-acetyltransferase